MVARTAVVGVVLLGIVAQACAADTQPSFDDPLPLQRIGVAELIEFSSGRLANAAGEEVVRVCMAEEGFVYVPRGEDDLASLDPVHAGPEVVRSYLANEGFGITTRLDTTSTFEEIAQAQLLQGPPDPNDQILNGLDSAGLAAYYQAMTKCQEAFGTAWKEAADRQEARLPQEAVEARRILADIADEMIARGDDEEAAARRAWLACMRRRGYPLGGATGPDDGIDLLMQQIADRLAALADRWADNGAIDADELRAIQQAEIAMASDYGECSLETIWLHEYRFEYRVEERFIEEHPDIVQRLSER